MDATEILDSNLSMDVVQYAYSRYVLKNVCLNTEAFEIFNTFIVTANTNCVSLFLKTWEYESVDKFMYSKFLNTLFACRNLWKIDILMNLSFENVEKYKFWKI